MKIIFVKKVISENINVYKIKLDGKIIKQKEFLKIILFKCDLCSACLQL